MLSPNDVVMQFLLQNDVIVAEGRKPAAIRRVDERTKAMAVMCVETHIVACNNL